MIVLRKCNKCYTDKPLSEFHKDNSQGKLYYKGKCKSFQVVYDKSKNKIYLKRHIVRCIQESRKKIQELYGGGDR